MPALLLTDIGLLAGTHPVDVPLLRGRELSKLPVLKDAWLLCEDGLIKDFGLMTALPEGLPKALETISAHGGYVFPSWCDSHTHLVYANSREEEFVMKIQGKSYEDIAAAGGGILNSARSLQQASEEQLFESAWGRLEDVIKLGTGAIEIKSGYGLTTESELKMLRVIRRLKETAPIPVKASFLAAHAYPQEYKNNHEKYIDLIIHEMLPRVAGEGLADYIDVFCEKGFFSVAETDQILNAAAVYGLKPKIHANQLSVSGGVEIGLKHHALSVDHLEATDKATIKSLENGDTIATLLPSCSFYLNMPFADAAGLIAANVPVALATDYNPGSSPSGNMNFVVSLACIKLKMLPEEAVNAATLNGAAAMELSAEMGSIARGKRANLFITRNATPSLAFLPYNFGQPQLEKIILNGKIY
jgi:imidazolonepropionase